MIQDKPIPDQVGLLDELQRHDAVGAVVRAHFEIDVRLQRAVESLTLRPKELPELRYAQKARLAVALGLNTSVLPAVQMLGHLRDGAAVYRDAGLTDAAVNQLFGLLARHDREAVLRLHAHRCSGAFQEATALQRFNTVVAIIDSSLATSIAAVSAALLSDEDADPDAATQAEVVSFEWSPPPAASPPQRPRDLSNEALYSYLTAGDWSYWS